jgi:hypothetical protein
MPEISIASISDGKQFQSVIWRSFNELDQFVVAVLHGLV